MTEAFKELPDSWVLSDLGELSEYVQRGKSPKYTEKSDLPVINQKCVRWWGVDVEHLKYIHDDQAQKWDEIRFLRPGDVLWNSTGTGTIGRACVYRGELERVVVDSHVTIVRADSKALEPRYAFYFIMSPLVQADIEEMQSGSTNQVELSKKAIVEKQIPLAPLPEQQRIVEKIETLFARLDKGEEAVREVQKLLTRYRQSVLKSAVTGQLTADWRESAYQGIGDGHEYLNQVVEKRQENWQGRGKYKAAPAPDPSELPAIPSAWAWASLGQLMARIEAGKNFKCEERPPNPGEVGIVKISAVTWDEFDETESKTITNPDFLNESYLIEDGDLLISRANTVELVGASVVVKEVNKRLQLSDKVLRLRLVEPIEHWVNYVLKSPIGRKQIEGFATGAQMSMRNISQGNLERIAIPLPPPEEIKVCVDRIRDAHDRNVNLAGWCETELKRSASLRQSILKDAFAGRLVPQDPTDEPASALLARIAETKTPTKKTRRKVQA